MLKEVGIDSPSKEVQKKFGFFWEYRKRKLVDGTFRDNDDDE